MKANPTRQSRSGCEQPVPVADCLHTLPPGRRALELAQLNQRLQLELPPELSDRIVLASVRAGRALFLARSSAWAARTRLQQGRLHQILQALGQQVDSIDVKVVQPERTPRTQPDRKPLTAATAEHLRSVAASTSDPQLRARFLELAALAETSPD